MNTGTYRIKKLYKSALGVLCLILSTFPPVGSADDTQLVVVISSSRYEYEQASRAFFNTVAESPENIVTEKRLFLPGPGGEQIAVKPDKGFMIKCNKEPKQRFVIHQRPTLTD